MYPLCKLELFRTIFLNLNAILSGLSEKKTFQTVVPYISDHSLIRL